MCGKIMVFNFKKISIIFLFSLLFSIPAQAEELSEKLQGKILLQVEGNGQAWYVNPENNQRAFLGRPADAFRIMRELGLGISEKDYDLFENFAPERLSGRILLRVESLGEAYYVNPENLKLYYLGRPEDAFRVMRELGLGISNIDLDKIAVHKKYAEVVENNLTSLETYLVTKVVDGDTIDVLINNETKRVRIIGIDTPEIVDPRQGVECFGAEASERAKELLNNQAVILETDDSQDDTDKYGRLLRHIILQNGNNFAEQMVREGLAREYTYNVKSKYQTDFLLAENEAKENKRGIWTDGACDDYVDTEKTGVIIESFDSDIVIADIFYDGLDNPLEGDEYVEILNNGVKINLRNYILSDESEKLFIFPGVILENDTSLKVFTGCGADLGSELYWCHTDSAVWNNSGDKAILKDNEDRVVASYSY